MKPVTLALLTVCLWFTLLDREYQMRSCFLCKSEFCFDTYIYCCMWQKAFNKFKLLALKWKLSSIESILGQFYWWNIRSGMCLISAPFYAFEFTGGWNNPVSQWYKWTLLKFKKMEGQCPLKPLRKQTQSLHWNQSFIWSLVQTDL